VLVANVPLVMMLRIVHPVNRFAPEQQVVIFVVLNVNLAISSATNNVQRVLVLPIAPLVNQPALDQQLVVLFVPNVILDITPTTICVVLVLMLPTVFGKINMYWNCYWFSEMHAM